MEIRIDISNEEPDADEPQFLVWAVEKFSDSPHEGAGEHVLSCIFELEDRPLKIMHAIDDFLPKHERSISMLRLIEHVFLAGFERGVKYAQENK